MLREYWTEVRATQLVKLTPSAAPPKAATSFQIQREGSILHLGIVCQEPDMAGLNICRQRVRGTTTERTAYSATGKDDFHVPDKFAKLWGK